MNIQDGETIFGEWLPDQTIFRNPGLTEARNCIPSEGGYKPFLTLNPSGDALSETPLGALATVDDNGSPVLFVGTQKTLQERVGTNWTDRSGVEYTTVAYWRFAQFDNYVIATNYADVPQGYTIGAVGDFADLAATGTAPRGRQVGVINRFVMLGDIDNGTAYPYAVQWPAIDDPTDWPTPGTSDARTKQAGFQYLDSSLGAVTGITNGQFSGLVFQKHGITRAQYIGGDLVFQFNTFEFTRGLWAPRSLIQIGNRSYFIASDGFYVTDGQAVTPIGAGKVDRWFFEKLEQSRIDEVEAGFDLVSKSILWRFPSAAAPVGSTDCFIVYNFALNRFSWAQSPCQLMVNAHTQGYTLEQIGALFPNIDEMTVSLDSPLWQGGYPVLLGFIGAKAADFNGAALEAVFETGEFDMNPFGYTFIRGIRPLVTGSPNYVASALAARDTQDNASRQFGPDVFRNSRSRVCGFRKNGRFLSSRLTVKGGFDRVIGLQVDAEAGDLM